MAEFAELEAVDGVRMPWNVWPNNRVEIARCVIPLAAVVTPLHTTGATANDPDAAGVLELPYLPQRCRSCSAVLNPYCPVDFASKNWTCPFDFQRNSFPQHYAQISEANLPGELCQSTVEYILDPGAQPPIFLFLLDTCLIEEELGYLKSALRQALELMPENALVGLITFGTNVFVHELGHEITPRANCFRVPKEGISKEQILEQLGLSRRAPGAPPRQGVIAGVKDGLSQNSIDRFLISVSQCELILGDILEDLQRDSYPQADTRASRCTGSALNVAAGLLGSCIPGTGARIMAFVGGPCTEGPGMIAGTDISEMIRSHRDISKDAAPYFHQAVKFYDGLASQLVTQGHVLDVFACALDQVGLAEMKVCVEKTGGLVILAESFGHHVFKDSFKKLFEAGSSLELSFNGIFEVFTSKEVKLQGIIGPCSAMQQTRARAVSDTVIGQGNTSAWKLAGFDKNTSLTIFFDLESGGTPQSVHLQFTTHYQRSDGQTRYRVTTITRNMVDGSTHNEDLVNGFDQEAAAAVTAKLLSFKIETEDDFNPTRWMDRLLIRLCRRFGDYQKDEPATFALNPRLSLFPQFMFHLRRSQFVQVFNNSPDETAQFRMVLNRENVLNSLVMIQPTLMSYSLNAPPEAAMLDVAAVIPDRILFLDAFFSIVIFHGSMVAEWRNAGYHKQEEYSHIAELLEAPHVDARAIIKERFPVPRLVVCDQYKSQARFLLAKLNPSATYSSTVPAGSDIIFTDDVSYSVFIEHLQRLAVASQG